MEIKFGEENTLEKNPMDLKATQTQGNSHRTQGKRHFQAGLGRFWISLVWWKAPLSMAGGGTDEL